MSEIKHSPEPWAYRRSFAEITHNFVDFRGLKSPVAKMYKGRQYGLNQEICDANAARIVACVNACAGMEDPVSEIARLKAIEKGMQP